MVSMEKKKILVAMSGGVDSSVTAALLKEEGHEVGGATIRTWASNQCEDRNTKTCCGLTGVEDARDVADSLGIPYWVFNFEKEFKTHVVDYFASEYMKGRTPNPCMACNEHIKFRLFLSRAKKMGYDFMATGHYAQLHYDPEHQSHYITEGVDASKDQSYVLVPLDKDLLPHLFLPLGHFTKAEIRAKARALNLCVMDKPDSQEICFIPSNNYGAFLKREYLADKEAEKGVIRTREGKVMGQHDGYYHYTRGQRRGLGVPYKERLYVLETHPETNEVVVGTKEQIHNRSFWVSKLNWFLKPTEKVVRCAVKIRSQHDKASATIHLCEDNRVRVEFDQAQDAITPGQAAAFYDGTKIFGGGWVEQVETSYEQSGSQT